MKFSHLPRVYIDESLSQDKKISIQDKLLHYLKQVMRLKSEQLIRIFNAQDGEFLAKIISIDKSAMLIKLDRKIRNLYFNPPLILAICIIKPERFSEAIRSAIQIGVTKIIPVISSRTQFKSIAREKIQKIILQSIQQSERFKITELSPILTLTELMKEDIEQIIFANESENEPNKIKKITEFADKICVLIGPEGGFTEEEKELIKSNKNVRSVSLGSSVLRTETASTCALACVQMMRG
ncbi:MAG TPA: RsmE family RNA methyltransferase [Candidatus Megaira endosymbiont of Nemacystus decipiens]|nr:RsmE family RNA methyltransferase [Candidatus Megaera endosymbiont of Nemacystus decipiens]